ncbi:MAG: iron transporter [Thermoleophilia bacterium]|nr:iron transporter [Thermoleophilia bacterium]
MGSGLVVLREGFEASLVVAAVLAFLDRSNRRDGFAAVWIGIALALCVSAIVGITLFAVGAELEGTSEYLFEAITTIAAATLLVWMIFWMRRQSRSIRTDLEGKTQAALADGSAIGLGAVAFVGVVREGIETSLLLFSTTGATSPLVSLASAVVGLVLAIGLGYAFYRGSHRLDLRRFFTVTSAILLLFAGWLLAKGLEELAEAGVIPSNQLILWGAFALLAAPTLWLFFRPVGRKSASA